MDSPASEAAMEQYFTFPPVIRRAIALVLSLGLTLLLTACGGLPARSLAQDRLFLDLKLDFLDEYILPKAVLDNAPVGGLSAITYDRKSDRFYALSDDRGQFSPARFYTLKLSWQTALDGQFQIDAVSIDKVTLLNNQGETYPVGAIDPEGIALSPRHTLFIASEGNINQGIAPFIGEFELATGRFIQSVRLPERFLANTGAEIVNGELRGIQNNLGFEALTISAPSIAPSDPFRLFAATESALFQDHPPKTPENAANIRLLHYVINSVGPSVLVAEHLYPLEASDNTMLANGLSEILALDQEGFLLSLERNLSFAGFGAKLFQVATGNASDTSRLLALGPNLERIRSLRKELLLDLQELPIDLDNLEGMTWGPSLPDGDRSLILISDDNFRDEQVTQFLVFRLSL